MDVVDVPHQLLQQQHHRHPGTFDCNNTSKMYFDVRSASDFTTNPAAGQNLVLRHQHLPMGNSGDVIVMRVGYVYPLYLPAG